MARTQVSAHEPAATGTALTATTGQADGYKFRNTGRTYVRVTNTNGAASRTVTFQTPATSGGLAIAENTVTLSASQSRIFGPFAQSIYNQPSDPGLVFIDFDSGNESDLEFEVIEVG